MVYCFKVPIYMVLDAVQNESSYCCGALLKQLSLSLSCCLAKPFELMISQFIWKRSLPGQPSVQIQFTGSYHRVVMGIFSHWVVGQFDHYCSEHMLLITAQRGRWKTLRMKEIISGLFNYPFEETVRSPLCVYQIQMHSLHLYLVSVNGMFWQLCRTGCHAV